MTEPNQLLIASLSSPSQQEFYAALPLAIRIPDYRGKAGARLIIAFGREMVRRADLNDLRQAERLAALIRRLGLNSVGTDELAANAGTLPPNQSNTIAEYLSPAQRLRLVTSTTVGSLAPQIACTSAPTTPHTELNVQPDYVVTVDALTDHCSTVLLLAKSGGQDANKQLLKKSGFAPVLLDELGKVRTDLETNVDICACVVDGSFLQPMAPEEQTSFFGDLASYSSFIWIRVDETGLKIPHDEVRRILRTARCQRSQVAAQELSVQRDGVLRETELPDIERACALLRTQDSAQFFPGEISDEERMVLAAATREHAQELHCSGSVEVVSVETRFLQGGFSGAKLALVRANREGRCIVGKIGPKEYILQELKRFRVFVQEWDDKLQPKAFFHGPAAVILFCLVPDEGSLARPAPMLEQCLQDLWNEEVFRDATDQYRQRIANLSVGLENVAALLCELNKRAPSTCEFSGFANPDMKYLRNLETKQIDWGFPDSAREVRALAENQFARLAQAAIVHGDVHLRNILVRGDRDMHLIDYAGSGPGHPAVDLVRLELALYLGCAKQLEDEVRCTELQRDLSLVRTTVTALESKFPAFHRSGLNRVCMRGCTAARDRALDAVIAHGGDYKDYVAAKYLVAWQSLLMEGRQCSLTRSVINALAPGIAAWQQQDTSLPKKSVVTQT